MYGTIAGRDEQQSSIQLAALDTTGSWLQIALDKATQYVGQSSRGNKEQPGIKCTAHGVATGISISADLSKRNDGVGGGRLTTRFS